MLWLLTNWLLHCFFYLNVFLTLKTSRDMLQGEHSQEQHLKTIHCMNGFHSYSVQYLCLVFVFKVHFHYLLFCKYQRLVHSTPSSLLHYNLSLNACWLHLKVFKSIGRTFSLNVFSFFLLLSTLQLQTEDIRYMTQDKWSKETINNSKCVSQFIFPKVATLCFVDSSVGQVT